MNYDRGLSLFYEMIGCGHELYFAVFDPSFSLVDSNCPFSRWLPRLLDMNGDALEQTARYAQSGTPVILSTGIGLLWIIDYHRLRGGELQAYHVLGPVFLEDIPAHSVDLYLSDLGISGRDKRLLAQQIAALPLFPINHFADYGLMQHYCLTGEKKDPDIFAFADRTSAEESLERAKTGAIHGTWAMEQELLRLIEEGNPDYKQRSARLVGKGQMMPLGNGNTLRHVKNTSIIFTALCARAAMRGGLTPEVAYSLSDRYIIQLEKSMSFEEVVQINAAMQEDYVSRVHQCRQKGLSPMVQSACQYLENHIGEKLSVPALAEKMGYSVTYLTRVFKRQTGMTVNEYLLSQRIRQAKEALRGSREPIQSISQSLGFGSHSYFTAQFKAAVGMTPVEYRLKNGVCEQTLHT